jgi:hypothetical protein
MLCHYAEYDYDGCHYDEWHYDGCHYAEWHYDGCHYAEWHYDGWHYDEWHYDEWVCDDKNDVSERREKRLQRRFIKKHLAMNGRRLRHKFIEDINSQNVAKNRRYRRDDSKNDDSASDVTTDVETVLTDLADQVAIL